VRRIIRRLPGPAALKEKLGRMAEQILLAIRAFHNVGRFAGFTLLVARAARFWAGASRAGRRPSGVRHFPA
jgi:hypothetical protein